MRCRRAYGAPSPSAMIGAGVCGRDSGRDRGAAAQQQRWWIHRPERELPGRCVGARAARNVRHDLEGQALAPPLRGALAGWDPSQARGAAPGIPRDPWESLGIPGRGSVSSICTTRCASAPLDCSAYARGGMRVRSGCSGFGSPKATTRPSAARRRLSASACTFCPRISAIATCSCSGFSGICVRRAQRGYLY